MENNEQHFKAFKKLVEQRIKSYGPPQRERDAGHQRKLMGDLLDLEEKFKDTLIKSKYSEEVYSGFVHFITEEKKNILAARPFWRTRNPLFTSDISPILKEKDWRRLYKYPFNYLFIHWAIKTFKLENTRLGELAKQVEKLRNHLVELNYPIIINRASIFFRCTPTSHLNFIEEIQLATEGLLIAIDKFTPAKDAEWTWSSVIGVGIGRMTGLLISNYSTTHLHFYPSDRKKIYRANKWLARNAGGDVQDLISTVNKDSSGKDLTNEDEIAGLISAVSILSADAKQTTTGEEDIPTFVASFEAPESYRPDVQYEERDTYKKLHAAIMQLTPFQRKIIQLKGIQL
jgi:hypothetical protein